MLRLQIWNAATKRMEPLANEKLPARTADLTAEAILWIDLESPSEDEEKRVFAEFFPVHPLTLEDITKPQREPETGPHLPKVEEFADYLFAIVNPLPQWPADAPKRRWKRAEMPQLSAVLTEQVLITHHSKPVNCIGAVQRYVERHPDCSARGPDFLFHLILDSIVDESAPVVEKISDQLDAIERRMFTDPSQKLLAQLLKIKRKVSYLRKTLILEREVLARLIRGEFQLVDTREIAYYRNVYDHLVRYTELIEAAREMVSDLMQTHLAAASNRLNQVMKVLTMISTIILPMTLIAGIYGMNFAVLPEKDWRYGYPFALGMMALVAVAGFIFFKWKKWI